MVYGKIILFVHSKLFHFGSIVYSCYCRWKHVSISSRLWRFDDAFHLESQVSSKHRNPMVVGLLFERLYLRNVNPPSTNTTELVRFKNLGCLHLPLCTPVSGDISLPIIMRFNRLISGPIAMAGLAFSELVLASPQHGWVTELYSSITSSAIELYGSAASSTASNVPVPTTATTTRTIPTTLSGPTETAIPSSIPDSIGSGTDARRKYPNRWCPWCSVFEDARDSTWCHLLVQIPQKQDNGRYIMMVFTHDFSRLLWTASFDTFNEPKAVAFYRGKGISRQKWIVKFIPSGPSQP